jgi:hypothetical protein
MTPALAAAARSSSSAAGSEHSSNAFRTSVPALNYSSALTREIGTKVFERYLLILRQKCKGARIKLLYPIVECDLGEFAILRFRIVGVEIAVENVSELF